MDEKCAAVDLKSVRSTPYGSGLVTSIKFVPARTSIVAKTNANREKKDALGEKETETYCVCFSSTVYCHEFRNINTRFRPATRAVHLPARRKPLPPAFRFFSLFEEKTQSTIQKPKNRVPGTVFETPK